MMRRVLLLLLTVVFVEVSIGIAASCDLLGYCALSKFHIHSILILYLLTEALATALNRANIANLELAESNC